MDPWARICTYWSTRTLECRLSEVLLTFNLAISRISDRRLMADAVEKLPWYNMPCTLMGWGGQDDGAAEG